MIDKIPAGIDLWEFQKALVSTLSGFAPLTRLLAVKPEDGATPAVYDYTPPTSAYPYLKVSEPSDTDASPLEKTGANVFFTIHVWSRYAGSKEVLLIYSQIRRLLHLRTLPLAGACHVYGAVRLSATLEDPDGLTRHGVISYENVLMEPSP